MLSPRTEKDYRQVVERWTRDGQPDPVTWVSERSSEATRRNARAGLVWHFRVTLGRTLDIPWVRPMHQPVPSAFSVEELATIREEALDLHRRCRPVIDLLYSYPERGEGEKFDKSVFGCVTGPKVARPRALNPGGRRNHAAGRGGGP